MILKKEKEFSFTIQIQPAETGERVLKAKMVLAQLIMNDPLLLSGVTCIAMVPIKDGEYSGEITFHGQVSLAGASFCYSCSAGKYKQGASPTNPCKDCPSGFKGILVQGSGIDCEQCKPGSYQKEAGTTYCLPCVPGEFKSSYSATFCESCQSGKYQSEKNATQCHDCPSGYAVIGKANAKCFPCIPGLYNDVVGATNCKDCSSGKFQDAVGNATCRKCPSGFGNSVHASAGCNAVPPGSYEIEGKQKECEQGYKCEGAGKARQACPPGSYASLNGSVACVECPPGRTAAKDATVECEYCDVGLYQPEPKQTVCKSCIEENGKGSGNTGTGNTGCVSVPWIDQSTQ